MMSAIESDKVDFVELLLDNGVDIKTFLTTKKLLELYNGKRKSASPFSELNQSMRRKEKMKSTEEISMEDVGKLIKHLLDDYYLQKYSPTPAQGNGLSENDPLEIPFLHLLIWAVLNNLQYMAKLFWRKGMDSIAAALLAHALLSKMARRLKNARPNQPEDIEANSCEFADLATGVLDKCYRTNESYARVLLTGELFQWEKASCILIAMKTKNKTFMSTTACHEVFNNVWMGKITQDNGILKLLICMFIPPLITPCVQFKENKDNEPDPVDDTSNIVQDHQATGVSNPDVSQSRLKEKIPLFYRAPVVHFLSHAISYIAFLCLYSYILITKFDQKVSVEEGILIAWVVHIFVEEIRQVIATRYIYSKTKLKAYIADFWNIADILMILLFVIGTILKHLPHQETLEAARVVLGINLILYFLRLLQMFSLNKELGPKLVMIIRMVRNLTSFFVMLLIFIVAYAIASHAILYPNTEISFDLLRVIFRRPYWNIYGELMLDEIEGTNDCTNTVELYQSGTQPRCPTESGKYVVPVLMGVYMLMCNILLLNLLISIFSNTFETVHKNADMHWRVQRYHQIQEYITRPMFVPFISLIKDVFRTKLFLKNDTSGTNVFFKSCDENRKVEDVSLDKVRQWERSIAQDFINNKKADLQSIDNSVKTISQRLDQLVSKIDALQEEQYTATASIVARLYRGQIEIEKQLQSIVKRLNEQQPGAEKASPEETDERVEGDKKADPEIIDHSIKAENLRRDPLFSKSDALEEQQHALHATIDNARLHPSQTDCVAKSESSTVDEPDLDQSVDNIENVFYVSKLEETKL